MEPKPSTQTLCPTTEKSGEMFHSGSVAPKAVCDVGCTFLSVSGYTAHPCTQCGGTNLGQPGLSLAGIPLYLQGPGEPKPAPATLWSTGPGAAPGGTWR